MKPCGAIMAAALAAVLCGPALAQEAPPALVVKVQDKPEPLELAKLDTEVRIFGYLAETKMTMTFRNPHGRALAGDLYFPLPEGATVSGYALDIQGKLIDGVVVEKPKARQVFEEIVRQGVDPGLVEWVKGNNFKTRVFPIPAGGTRTIMVKYVADLVHDDEDLIYHLPLKALGKDGRKVGQFSLRVEVARSDEPPVIREGELENFKFARGQRGYAAETKIDNAAFTKDLAIGICDEHKQPVLVEKGPEGEFYFCINDYPRRPGGEPVGQAPPPRRITLLWDASGSRGASDHRRELDVLAAYCRTLQAAPVAVDVVVFRDTAAQPRHFDIHQGNAEALLAALRALDYDGGTQLAAISPPPGAAEPDFYLLFTDGISDFGHEDPTELNRPVYVLSADATANHPFLRYLALRTGGEYFNLNRVKAQTVVASIGRPAYAFLSAKVQGAQTDETYPRLVQPVHGLFTLAGRLTADEATVTLSYGTKGKVLNQSQFTVSRSAAVEGDLLRRSWAQKKVDHLAVFPKRNEQEIVAVGKKHSLVTPGTSLLVLDSLEQYVQHGIAPPKSLPEMYAEYQRRMDTVEMQQKKARADKIDRVLAMWGERVKWWQTEFKYAKDFKYTTPQGKSGGQGGGGGGPGEGLPSPMVAPASPPSPTAAEPAAPASPRRTREVFRGAPANDRDGGADLSLAAADVPAGGESGALTGQPGGPAPRPGQPGVLIKPWDPKTPYLQALQAAPPDRRLGVYMEQRKAYGNSPAFFLDCAEFFREAGLHDLAIQVLSNVAELELENAALLRVLAHKLAQWDRLELAAGLFEEALKLRPEEPQSYRDLALVLARLGRHAHAIELLNDVVMKPWDNRFPEIETIALMELNRLIPKAKAAGVDTAKLGVDPRLVSLLDVDVRIILTWDADMTDIDLWVTEPSGEKVFYGHNRSTIGARMSHDFTRGYGPEEYCLHKAMNGVFKIEVNYYGTSAASLLGAVTLQVDVFTNFGRPNEQHKSLTRRLRTQKETIPVGEIEY